MNSLETWVRIHTFSLWAVLKIYPYGKGVSKSTVLKVEKINQGIIKVL